jgi:hypothetical protein
MAKRAALTADTVRRLIELRSDLDILRMHYCYQLGSTFVNLALMEDSVIEAMAMCNGIKVADLLGPDAPAWKRMQEKTDRLRGSTLGSLIGILAKHGVSQPDLRYLRWVKEKRDYFVHRLFNENHWPGELDAESITILCRRLLYLEAIFVRASRRIWKIFANADLLTHVDLGGSGVLMINRDLSQD